MNHSLHYYMIYKRKKNKRKKKRTKTTLKIRKLHYQLFSPQFFSSLGFYMQKGVPGNHTGPYVEGRRVAPQYGPETRPKNVAQSAFLRPYWCRARSARVWVMYRAMYNLLLWRFLLPGLAYWASNS